MSLTKSDIEAWLEAYAQKINTHVDELNKMDGAIGDGDFGETIQRGFNTAVALLPTLKEEDIGTTLSKIGKKMMSLMGGTSGPLVGTLYIKTGGALKGKMDATDVEFAHAFKTGVEAVMALGKAQIGDKTMIDSYLPAAEALVHATEQGSDWPTSVEQALEAAKTGYESTAMLVAKKGRSSYLGERGRGAIDPGAYGGYLLIEALQEATAK